jgi:integrase/recombinase XerD
MTGQPDELARLLAEHEDWLAVERGLAPNSRAAYRRDLRRYAVFLRDRGEADPAEIGEATVQAYVGYLSALRDDAGHPLLVSSSIARALVAVRSFHGFCAEEGLLPTDPSEEVDAPRVPLGIPKALDESQVELLLGAVTGDGPLPQRDRALLETLYATGIRISEAVWSSATSISTTVWCAFSARATRNGSFRSVGARVALSPRTCATAACHCATPARAARSRATRSS